MECANCKVDIGGDTRCPKCDWSTESPSDDPIRDALASEPEEPPDASDALQDDSTSDDPPEPENTDSESDSPEPRGSNSRGVQFNTQDAEIRNQIGQFINHFYAPEAESKKKQQKHSLYDDTYPLGESPAQLPECLLKELETGLRELDEAGLLIIACASSEIAVSAAHRLIGVLEIHDKRRTRGFNVKDKTQDGFDIAIESFLPKEEEKDGKKAAVIVDARTNSGHAFVTSLIGDSMARGRLKDNQVYVLCIVTPAYIDGNRQYPNWKISYLDCLLKSHFPTRHSQIKSEIEKQVELGWWNTDESKLCYEVKGYIDEGRLLDEIEKRKEIPPPPPPPNSIFIDEQYIEKTVVYVAAYFPDLSPAEFCELVEALLPDRKVYGPVADLSDNETLEKVGASKPNERPIIEIWRDHKDDFMWGHLRETVSAGEIRVIDFANPRARDAIKHYLSQSRRYYVKDQFNILQTRGFLFHPSTRVSGNMAEIIAENAFAYPDEYNKDWLTEIIRTLRDRYQSNQNGSEQPANGLFRFLDRVPFNKASWGYSRISELIRALMKTPQTADVVNRSLSDLMRLHYHDAVLNVVKRLRFVADFDELYWLKQLFDRGDLGIRSQAFTFLYDTLKQADADIYQTLGRLDSWLPTPDRSRRNYPKSAGFALRLLIKYCFESIYRFTQSHNGSEPGDYPLFSFQDDTAAEQRTSQLIEWLLHPAVTGTLHDLESDPAMKNVLANLGFQKNPERLCAILLAEWSVVLLGYRRTDTITTASKIPEDGQSEPVNNVLRLLLSKIRSRLSELQQRELVAFWEKSNRQLLRSLTNPRLSKEEREQLAVRWNRVFSLTQEFRKMHLTAKAS